MSEKMSDRMVRRAETADAVVAELLSKLTREEKVQLCHSVTKFSSGGIERLGVPRLVMSDGPHGVRQEICDHSWDSIDTDTDTTTYLPVGVATASTWNPELAYRSGQVLGAEARARGKDVILGPGVNIVRSPLCGRNFEYYSEDPCLSAALAVEVVRGIQSQDTAACVKHFACNSQEWNRHQVDARPTERTLREIYLPAFEAAVKEGGALTLMGAYNKLHGQWCCHNRKLLVDILKGEWGFEGAVISDWGGCHETPEAIANGLDIEMGTDGEDHLDQPYLKALEAGEADEAGLDDKVRRVLRVMVLAGCFDEERLTGAQHPPEHIATARAIADEAPVLLKNHGVLPFDRGTVRKLAVIGENATLKHAGGGGSSEVKALHEVTPLEGLQRLLGDEVEIVHAPGYPDNRLGMSPVPAEVMAAVDSSSGVKGWQLEYSNRHDFDDDAIAGGVVETVALCVESGARAMEGIHIHGWAARWRGTLVAPESGVFTFGLASDGWARLWVDGVEMLSYRKNHSREPRSAAVKLKAGQAYAMRVEYGHQGGHADVRLGWLRPGEEAAAGGLLEEAVAAAREADAVVVFGGLTHRYDNEGADRSDLQLHGGQDALIEAVVEANPNTAVVLIAGSPVELPWIDRVPALLYTGYAGMETGHALAEILFGAVNPSGKLTVTWPRRLLDSPAHAEGDYHSEVCHYAEGVMVGYRWFDTEEIEPRFPFGHGLSYTAFEYSDLLVTAVDPGDDTAVARVSFKVTNTGEVAGREVAQVYISDVACSVPRPWRELKAFEKVALAPGESVDVARTLSRRDFSYFDTGENAWCMEPGGYRVLVGSSSRDMRLQAMIRL